jgi:hypothetical protein
MDVAGTQARNERFNRVACRAATGSADWPCQGTITVNWPGAVMLITPAQVHMHLQLLLSVGKLPSVTVGAPGIQGATVSGTQASVSARPGRPLSPRRPPDWPGSCTCRTAGC